MDKQHIGKLIILLRKQNNMQQKESAEEWCKVPLSKSSLQNSYILSQHLYRLVPYKFYIQFLHHNVHTLVHPNEQI